MFKNIIQSTIADALLCNIIFSLIYIVTIDYDPIKIWEGLCISEIIFWEVVSLDIRVTQLGMER